MHQKRVKKPAMSMKPLSTSAMPNATTQVSRRSAGSVPAAKNPTSGSFMTQG